MIELEDDSVLAARQLLGWRLQRRTNKGLISGIIVETEAYDQKDAASHSYRGRTPRTDIMFGPSGFAYVYFTYGMHYCFNVVVGQPGYGSAVLIRALEPLEGIELMVANRSIPNQKLYTKRDGRHKRDALLKQLTDTQRQNLCNGPAKLCYALEIDKSFNGHDLAKSPLKLVPGEKIPSIQTVRTTRIGITKDTHRLWRFYLKNNTYVSKR